jgi:hypothetical protein
MRIRTDDKHAHREDTIDQVADFYERNRTESLLRAADDVPQLVRAIGRALERDDLTHEQRRELAERLSTRHFNFHFEIEGGDIEANVKMD